jgi:hydroxymethylpyrimidine kinase/phosphomethylpyrimidine kinase/thiamine-phosphate diphosphorylase
MGCGRHELVDSTAVAAIKKHLFPVAHIITPNLPEAALLLKKPVESKVEAMVEAAKVLAGMGPQWVLVKGGHMDGGMCSDVLLESKTGNVTVIEGLHLATHNTHGTGCTLASSIAALLAQGLSTVEAVTKAKHFVWDAIRCSAGLGLGAGHGPLNHQYATAHWSSPWSERSLCRRDKPVHRGKPVDYALYAVTDDAMIAAQGLSLAAAVDAAIRGGVTVVQLRQKEVDSSVMLKAANQLMAVCRPRGVPLIINDRVDIALACDADGVHVGQDDLPCDVVRRMLGPHKIVGVSVKTRQEVAQAERDGADYVGSGAVYPTSTKDSSAIGVKGIALVCSGTCLPVVAIGGVNGANCGDSIAAGASGIAVVSAIFNKPDPKTAAQELAAAVHGALARRKAA